MREKISELLDDELESAQQEEVLRTIAQDSDLAATWQRYHLIRAAVRNESIVHLPGFSERVQSALEQGERVAVRQEQKLGTFSTGVGKWAPGFALAASLAGLAVFGFFQLQPGQSSSPSSKTEVVRIDNGTQWETSTPDLEHSLNAFLVEHGEFSSMPSMNGLMAYAKFVSYDSAE